MSLRSLFCLEHFEKKSLYITSCMPYKNSCRSLKMNVMKLVNIPKDGHFYWLSFEIWTSTVAFILRELQAFLWAMLWPICEAYQPLMTILCIFHMLNIYGFWHGTLKIGLPFMSRNITICDLDFCAKFQLSWMIKNVLNTLYPQCHYVKDFDGSWLGAWGEKGHFWGCYSFDNTLKTICWKF